MIPLRTFYSDRLLPLASLSVAPHFEGEGVLTLEGSEFNVQWEISVFPNGDHRISLSEIGDVSMVRKDGTMSKFRLIGRSGTGWSVECEKLTVHKASSSGYLAKALSDIRLWQGIEPFETPVLQCNVYLGVRPTALNTTTIFDDFTVQTRRAAGSQVADEALSIGISGILSTEVAFKFPNARSLEDATGLVRDYERMLSFATCEDIVSPLRILKAADKQPRWIVSYSTSRNNLSYRPIREMQFQAFMETWSFFSRSQEAAKLDRMLYYLVRASGEEAVEVKWLHLLLAFENLLNLLMDELKLGRRRDQNLLEKLRALNVCWKWIPKRYTETLLRDKIRNPLLHTGVIEIESIWEMYDIFTDYHELLMRILFRHIGYSGQFTSMKDPMVLTSV